MMELNPMERLNKKANEQQAAENVALDKQNNEEWWTRAVSQEIGLDVGLVTTLKRIKEELKNPETRSKAEEELKRINEDVGKKIVNPGLGKVAEIIEWLDRRYGDDWPLEVTPDMLLSEHSATEVFEESKEEAA